MVRRHKPNIDNLGGLLVGMFNGKDATILPGITDYSWMMIASETGTDLTRWKSEKHFSSWLRLSPKQNNSGRKKKGVKQRGGPRARQTFLTLAQSIIESKKMGLGAFGRRLKSRKGPQIATKAVARKLAEQYWRLMVNGVEYVENGVAAYEEKILEQKRKYLRKLALELDTELIMTPAKVST